MLNYIYSYKFCIAKEALKSIIKAAVMLLGIPAGNWGWKLP